MFTLCLCLIGGTRFPVWGDALQTWDAAFACLTVGLPRIPLAGRPDAILGPDGFYYTKYPLLPILQAIPALWFNHFLPQSNYDGWRNLLVMLPAYLSAAVGAAALASLLQSLGVARARISQWTLICVFSTPWFVYARSYYAEGIQTSLLITLLLLWIRARSTNCSQKELFSLGLVSGLFLNCKPNLTLVVATICLDLLIQAYRSRGFADKLPFLAGLLPGLLLLLGYNYLRFGHISGFGYSQWRDQQLGFNVPLPFGAWGLLFSSGKSVFLYAPLLILSLYSLPRFWHERPELFRCVALITLPQFVLVACWWCWSGDDAWGPRLLVPFFPLWLLPTLSLNGKLERRFYIFLAGLGVLVNLLGALIHPAHYLAALPPILANFGDPQRPGEFITDRLVLVHYVPEFCPILGHGWLLAGHLGLPINRFYPWSYQRHQDWTPKADTYAPIDWWFSSSVADFVVLLGLGALTVVVFRWNLLNANLESSRVIPSTSPESSVPSELEDKPERVAED